MGSIEKKLSYLLGTKNAIREAIESKGVQVTDDATFREYAQLIKNINVSSGGSPDEDETLSDVTFYDYDGTVLHSYTKDEFLALEEMPELPSHGGLICEGWNWYLDEAKERVLAVGILDVGAVFNTYDGQTRIYVEIEDYNANMALTFRFYQSVPNGFVINWGDGSNEEEFDTEGNVVATHTFTSSGTYIIRILVKDDCILTLGQGTSDGSIVYGLPTAMAQSIKKIHLGDRLKVSYYSLSNIRNLKAITIPNSIQQGTLQGVLYRTSVKCIVLPRTIKKIETGFANYNSNLKILCLPYKITMSERAFGDTGIIRYVSLNNTANVTVYNNEAINCGSLKYVILDKTGTIGNSAFQSCSELISVVFCQNSSYKVTLSAYCFAECYKLMKIDWSNLSQVPSLSNVNAFNLCSPNLKHIVPDSLYDEWIAATNWSTFASQIIKKSDWDASQA